MKAWRVHELGALGNLSLDDVDKPAVGAHDVLVRVRAIGLNSSEAQIIRGEFEQEGMRTPFWWRTPLPLIPGIEAAGEVVEVGAEVKSHAVGDRVTVSYWWCCGQCDACVSGMENMCTAGPHFGTTQFGRLTDGAYAEFARVPAEFAIHLPEGVSYEAAAALTVAGGTAWHMLMVHGALQADETVLITGAASGIGTVALQLAKLAGARTIATAGNAAKLARLQEMGADHVIDHTSNPTFSATVRELTGGRGVDLVYEVPGAATIGEALSSLRPRGRIVVGGYMSGKMAEINLAQLIIYEARIFGSASWTRTTLRHVLDLASRGVVTPSIDSTWGFDELPAALEKLQRRDIVGKLVVGGP